MSKETIKVVQFDTDPAKKSIKDLRNELKQLKDQMANLEEGGDEFLEIANKAGELKHQLDEINESVKGASADFGDMVGNVTNIAAGLVGAFEAVAGGLQAMGVESEAVEETIVRMQGLMAVVQGLSAIDDGIKAMDKLATSITGTSKAAKLLKSVLQPKVFLAISAAIAGIVLVWNKWGDKIKEAIPFVEKISDLLGGNKAKIEEARKEQEKFNEELAISNEEVAEILKNRKWNAITKEAQDKIKFLEEEIKIYDNKVKNIVKQQETASDAEWNRLNEIGKGYLEQIRLWKNEIDDYYNNPKYQLSNQKKPKTPTIPTTPKTPTVEKTKEEILAEMGLVEFTDQDLAEGLERVKQYWEGVYDIKLEQNKRSEKKDAEKLAEEIRIEKERLTLYKEGTLEYERQLTKISELEKGKQGVIERALQNDRLTEMAKGWLYNEETAIETFDRISEELKLALERDLITQQEYDNAVKNITLERTRYITQQSIAVFSSTANLITSLLNGLADQQDQTNKEGFEKSKKLQIAGATIQMLAGITTAIAGAFTSKTGPWDWILAGIQAASIATTGALQIQKIKSTTFDGGGSATPSASAVNATIIPPVQYSNAVQGASTEGAIANQKVYVTESDIVGTINKVSVQEQENSY